jgi:diguanylate cyclase (GGDEF)-like protein/PAS domain S-box-containing protein
MSGMMDTGGRSMGGRLTTRGLLAGYAGCMVLLVAAHYAFDGTGGGLAAVLDIVGAAAIVVGLIRYAPARRAPWLLIAAANLTGALGQLTAWIQVRASHAPLPFPSYADAVYLVEFPLFVAGLALFIRARSVGRDRRSLADAVIVTVGLSLLSWLFLVLPSTTDPSFDWQQRVVSAAYPVGDLLIVVSLGRLLVPGGRRGAALWLLTIGSLAGIASDVGYDLVQNSPQADGSQWLSLGWLACYAACGAAALHPSMTELTRPAGRASGASVGSVLLLVGASLIPPVILFVHAVQRQDGVDGVVAVACGVLYLLMLSRLWDVAGSQRRSLVRERTLRMASSALASANTVEEVAAAVREAAVAIIPDTPARRSAVMGVKEGEYLRYVPPAGSGEPAYPPEPAALWLALAEGRAAKFVPFREITAVRHRTIPAQPSPDAAPAVPYEGALVCPLTLKDRPVGDPYIGLVTFFGNRRTLGDLAAALEILASQTALAVERVGLTQEVVRQRGEALFRTLVQDTSDVILIIGDDRRVRYATPSAVDIFGDVTVEGARLDSLVAPGAREDVDRVLDLMLSLSGDGASPGYLLQIERIDGRTAVLEVRWSDLRSESTVAGLVLTLRDVTEQHELEEELKYRAFHDALTGLPNRSLFAREAGAAMDAARAVGRTAGVLFVDLDDFKVVNDTMGHAVGDELLVAVAARLAAAVRQSDTAARLGGDEFALLIDDAADPEAVDAFAERIVAAFTQPFTLSAARVLATVTVGVATSADSGDVDEVLRHADLALYAAKTAGKRRWRHYQPVLTSGMLRRREIQAALEDAVQDSAFTLAYQPIVALDSGEIAGFESLLRWPHPRWGMMLPGQFISLAEETGLIVPLGSWVLRQSLRDMAAWRRELPPGHPGAQPPDGPLAGPPHVSVNVSARQFRDPGFADSVRQALRAAGLPPSALLLELTESMLLGESDRIRADLDELKRIGVRLAIDDFGTGYSSLSYLLELPIDVLKVDKTFVTGIASSWRRHALVEGIIRLARTLEVEVIAEGIESETERELLAAMGCQFGQGYLLSVPVDAATAVAMLKVGRNLVSELPRPRRQPPTGVS